MNLVDLAEQNYEMFGEITTIIFNDKEYTNVELFKSANKLANGLMKLGVKPQDKVLVMLMNSPDVIISYQGILRAGGIIIPVVFLLGEKEVAHILKNSEAVAIITSAAFMEKVKIAKEGIDTLKHVIIVEDEDIPGTIKYSELLAENSDEKPDVDIKEDDLAVILYTAGTTGVPKGVMLTHKNLYTNAQSGAKTGERAPEEIGLHVLPLSHSYGLTVMNAGWLFPNKNVLMPWFDLEGACKLIEKYKVTGFSGVPAMYAMMLNSPEVDKYDLSSLNECGSGSAPLPVEVLKAFEEKFNVAILEGYGLSEAAPVVSTHYRGRKRKPGSIGQAIPGVEVKIVDENDNEVPVGELGELIVKGPNISPGYYKLPEETSKTFKNGWLYTGDMAKIDEDEYLYIVERKKDLIIRGGFNIVPRDVDEVLHLHPAVIDAAVIGIPDPVMGEEIKAYVVLKEGETVTEEEIIQHCQEHLAKYKTPKVVEFLDALPRNPIGKIMRKELRELHAKTNE
ncbi:MAG: long-chain fatty acid--CoA ligase [Deltaproteobacteria bacterium]|nr:long-chain fatty acid--CoA ligase [Deltaproteobacteria bacterium]MBW2141145.1 long-chain fatty acid--CoA ligase [Deltaproteobacteria bacterium]MBW2323096.1 long-chain fatty acid--CoA ligase [Deltaproteobacteria bacterium]